MNHTYISFRQLVIELFNSFRTYDSTDSEASTRIKRIKLAALTSVVSKLVTVAIQLIAMPLAIQALGPDKFAVYAIITSIIGWVGISNLGVGPLLTVRVAEAKALGKTQIETILLSSALFPVSIIVITVGVLGCLLFTLLPASSIIGTNISTLDEWTIRAGSLLLLFLVLLHVILSVFEAVQAGYQQQYKFNNWISLGNLVSLVCLLCFIRLIPNLLLLIVIIYVPPLFARSFNITSTLKQNPHLLSCQNNFDWLLSKELLMNGFTITLVTLGSFINQQFPIILVGHSSNSSYSSGFAFCLNIFVLLFGMLSMVATPLWPAVADSVARGEAKWAQSAYKRFIIAGSLYAITICLLLAVGGSSFISFMTTNRINVEPRLMIVLGVYFFLASWEYLHYMMLIGLNNIKIPAILYIIRSVLFLSLANWLNARYQGVGLLVGLSVAVVLFTAITYPYMTNLTLRHLSKLSSTNTFATYGTGEAFLRE